MNTRWFPFALLCLGLGLSAQDSKTVQENRADQRESDQKTVDREAVVQERVQESRAETMQETGAKKKAEAQKADKAKGKKKVYKLPFTVGNEVDPGIELRDLDGKKHKLGDLRGKVVFIHFYSIRCPYEKVAVPKVNRISADYAKKGVIVLGIAANVNEIGRQPDAKAFEAKKSKDRPYRRVRSKARAEEIHHPILVDHESLIANKFRARTTPHCFVIDKAGILRYDGALDNDARGRKSDEERQDYVRLAIEATLAGKKPAVDKTRPYG